MGLPCPESAGSLRGPGDVAILGEECRPGQLLLLEFPPLGVAEHLPEVVGASWPHQGGKALLGDHDENCWVADWLTQSPHPRFSGGWRMLGQAPVAVQLVEGQRRPPWPHRIPRPGAAEGCGLQVSQGAGQAPGKEWWQAGLLHLLSRRMSGPHFQRDLWLLCLKKDLTVDRPRPSGLGLSLGPAGDYQDPMSLAVELVRCWRDYWEEALFDGLLPPQSGRGRRSDSQRPLHGPAR